MNRYEGPIKRSYPGARIIEAVEPRLRRGEDPLEYSRRIVERRTGKRPEKKLVRAW